MSKNKKEIIFIIAVLFISGIIGYGIKNVKAISYDEWYNYKILNFDDGFEGLQVNFNVTYGFEENGLRHNCQEDFEDLRFFDYLTNELLYAYNETTVNSDYCEIWLKLGSSKNVTLRYNNPEATAYWDIDAVFEDLISDLVLGLPMNEGSGDTVYDYSGNGNDGTITDALWVDGKYGKAVQFDGSTSKINIGDHYNIGVTDNLAFEFWIYPTADSSELISKGMIDQGVGAGFLNWQCRLYTYRIWVEVQDGTEDVDVYSSSISLDEWTHVVFTINRTTNLLKIYINGIPDGEGDISAIGDLTNTLDLLIGATHYPDYNYFEGIINEVCIYNQALNDTEIGNIYDFYGDSAILEGSVCCRVWVDVMPVVIFSTEYVSQMNLFITIAVLALVTSLASLLLISSLIKNKKSENKK